MLLALAPVDGADDLELLLVQRPGHLRQHAGQVGLPGGAVEPGDPVQQRVGHPPSIGVPGGHASSPPSTTRVAPVM